MADSMKFGPEWLRNLSQENSSAANTAAPTPKFQLAEHRYGREEMLALFDPRVVAPESLRKITALHIEKTQEPVLLFPQTEEENRTWNRGINSDAVLRVAGKGGQGPGTSSVSGTGSMRGGLSGRAGTMDRGRGRGRGFHYNRGLSYDESDGNSGPPSSYSRSIRSYERDRMQGERSSSWTERNGDLESSNQRKDFNNRELNWRRQDDDSWRTNRHDKWVRGSHNGSNSNNHNSNWRGDWDGNHRNDNSRGRLWDEPNHNRSYDAEDLPEWMTEKGSETGGSFDASGAFHGGGGNSDDEEERFNTRLNKVRNRESDDTQREVQNPRVSSEHSESDGVEKIVTNGPLTEKTKPDVTKKTKAEKSEQENHVGPAPLRHSHSTSSLSNSVPTRKISAPNPETYAQPHPLATSASLSGMPVVKDVKQPVEPEKKPSPPLQPVSEQRVQHSQPSPPLQQHIPEHQHNQQQNPHNHAFQFQAQHQHPYIQQPQVGIQIPIMHHESKAANPTASSIPLMKTEDAAEPEGMKSMQEAVAKLVEGEEPPHVHSKSVPHPVPRPPESDQWFYTDPQGQVQGPFSGSEMQEWFKSGYFSPSLMVRRADEHKFTPLQEHMDKNGKAVPFIPPAAAPSPVPPVVQMPEPPVQHVPNPMDEQALYHRMQLQNFLRHQAIMANCTKAEMWNALSPEQQMIMRSGMEQSMFHAMPPMAHPVPQMPPPVPTAADNPVGALLLQKLQQAQAQAQEQQQQQQQQQLAAKESLHTARNVAQTQPVIPIKADESARPLDPVISFLSQLQQNMSMKHDSVWSGPNPNAAGGVANAAHLSNWSSMPPLWGDMQPKMKTEQEILEEQRLEEARKKEELRKQEEFKIKKRKEILAEEEKRRQKKAEEEEAERKRTEELAERKRKKEEEEARRKEAAAKKAELERRKEEDRKRKEEEKRRKEDEKIRKHEEERKRQEEEKRRQEDERRRKEEEIRRAEQARKQTEALKRLQEQQSKINQPWAPPPAPAPSTSLSEIFRSEKMQQQQQQRELHQQQLEAQSRIQQSAAKSQFKWAEQIAPSKVKSLAEIQAEENHLAKQVEKEKEKERNGSSAPVSGIWSGQNLTWNNCNSASIWGNNTVATGGSSSSPGFWEETQKPQPKVAEKAGQLVQSAKSSSGKKTKKEEELVIKLFETPQRCYQEFEIWCTKALATVTHGLDVPTFITFLRDLESDSDVGEYVRVYLGDNKEASEFATEFLDRKSKLIKHTKADNRTAVSTMTNSNNFQEVKGKNKKPKKNKMMRVDNTFLGFNVTAAHDRINVGDRDYGDGI